MSALAANALPPQGTGAAAPTPAAPGPAWPSLRDDVQIHVAGNNRDGSPAWHLADPVRNLFFRIGWLEFEALRRWHLADPAAIAAAIAAETTLAPEADDIAAFAQFLQRQELVRETRVKVRRSIGRWLLHNYLFIRIPLVRPERLLRRCLPYVRWMLGPRFLVATLLAGIAGLLLAARQWDVLVANFRGAMSWDGFIAFFGALVFSKCVHELGHAFVATRNGVRVGHMGLALLVMFPMAYTDTGESWKLDKSRHRLATASAGVLAELALAMWCTFFWSFAPEGDFRNALFFLGTTAWVMTLLVNASPFMRFDGYFILSDALDFPGLHERAGRWAKRWVRWHLLGLRDPKPDVVSRRFATMLTGFAFATWIYRFVVFIGIAVIVYHAFFKVMGLALFVVEIVTFVVAPVMMEMRVWKSRSAEIDRRRVRRWLIGLAGPALVLLVPWSGRVQSPGIVEARAEQPVYPPYPARIERIAVGDGMPVQRGQLLFELVAATPEAERDKAQAMGEAYAATARGALALDRDAGARQVVAEQMARQYAAERKASIAELGRLHIVAAIDGEVRDVDQTLHEGSWVPVSTRMAIVVGGGTRWRAQALVSDADRMRLQVGGEATVYVKGRWQRLQGRIVAIDQGAVERLPSLLLAQAHGGDVPLNPTASPGELRPAGVWYRVMVEGEGLEAPLQAESRATLHFAGRRESLARRWIDSALLTLLQQTGLGKDG